MPNKIFACIKSIYHGRNINGGVGITVSHLNVLIRVLQRAEVGGAYMAFSALELNFYAIRKNLHHLPCHPCLLGLKKQPNFRAHSVHRHLAFRVTHGGRATQL